VSILAIAWALSFGDALAQDADRDQVSEARALFMAGRSAFAEGRYQAALDYFEKSYQLSGKPRLLYNIGQCHDRLRNDTKAIEALERYLEEAPEAENRRQVEARLEHLRAAVQAREARQGQQQAASKPDRVEAQQLTPPQQKRSVDDNRAEAEPGLDGLDSESFPVWPSITIAAGASVAIAGVVLMLLASSEGSDVEQAPIGASYPELQDKRDSAQQMWVAGQVLIGVGAAAAAGGVVWLILEERSDGETLAVSVAPSGLYLRGGF
jgi:tetratricopeptide (TPR) repeat protein